jgi:energy-converting hydrogenase Eha subunit G
VPLPGNFIAASILLAGFTGGAVCSAAAVYMFTKPERVNRLTDCAEKMSKSCKKLLDSRSNLGAQD